MGDERDDDDKGDEEGGSSIPARANARRPPMKEHANKRQRVQRLQKPTTRNRSKPTTRKPAEKRARANGVPSRIDQSRLDSSDQERAPPADSSDEEQAHAK